MSGAPLAPRPAAPASLRDRKRAEARAHVVDVAIALFAERDFASVSIAEVCRAAEISPRTFHRYFPAKEDVLLEPVREMAARVAASIAGAPPERGPRETLVAALRDLGTHVVSERTRLAGFFRVVATTSDVRASPFLQLAERERVVVEVLARRTPGAGPPDWRLRLLVAQHVAAFRVWLDDWRAGELPDPIAHLDAVLAAAQSG